MQELLSAINMEYRFKQIVSTLHKNSGMDERLFHKTKLAKRYWLDTRLWVDGSWMNPGAMYDMFGQFSDEDGKDVRARMIDNLGGNDVDKGANNVLLKNSWIALHMQGVSATEWIKKMRSPDEPGDEISLTALCMEYNRHCMVYTRANIWSTLHTDKPIDEDELRAVCTIRLLYIEPGVFGILKDKPYAKAPGKVCTESTTKVLKMDKKVTPNQQTEPLNLVTTHEDGSYGVTPTPVAAVSVSTVRSLKELCILARFNQDMIGSKSEHALNNNDYDLTLDQDHTSNVPVVKPCTVKLFKLTGMEIKKSVRSNNTDQSEKATSDNNSVTSDTSAYISDVDDHGATSRYGIKTCTVQLMRLEDTLKQELSKRCKESGYNLRLQQRKPASRRPNRRTHKIINYNEDELIDICSSEDSAKPSRDGMIPKPTEKPIPALCGPSQQRLMSQNLIEQKRRDAAQALLTLSSRPTQHANQGEEDDGSGTSTTTVEIDTPIQPPQGQEQEQDPAVSALDEKPKQKEEDYSNVDTGYNPGNNNKGTKNIDVAVRPKRQAEFVITKRVGIKRKYARKRVFKCTKCNFKESNLKRLRDHYRSKHGKLKCPECKEEFNTPSALRKHLYYHSEKVNKKSCPDCPKTFTFDSELKQHRLTHLSMGYQTCMTCQKTFKSKSELNKHVVSHSGKTWKCKKCKYSTNDPRNLRAHMHLHGPGSRYPCENCNKSFKYYQQLKRHRKEHKSFSIKRSDSPTY